MRKSGIIIAGITVALAVIGSVAGSSERVVSRAFDGSARTVSGLGGGDSFALEPVLEVGTEHVYDVSFAQSARTETAASSELAVALDGTWAVAYAGTDERGLVFRAELRDGRPVVRRGDVDASAAFTDRLHAPYYFIVTAEGRLIELRFAADLDDITRSTLAALASTFQVSSRSRAASWETVESDSLGDYRARYTRSGQLHRERVAYDRVAGGGVITASIVKTGTDIALRADGWPEHVTGTEATRVGTSELGVIVEAKFTMHHRAVARGVTPGWHDGLIATAVDATPSRTAQAEADRDLVAGASLADLLAELERIDDDHARGYHFLRIAALFRIDPDAARAAGRLVQDGAKPETASIVIGALGEAGTPEAQQALYGVLAKPGEDGTRAAIALGLTDAPTPATLTALEQAAHSDSELAATATLAQGNAALRINDDAPGASARLVEALLARLERAQTDEERALVIRALGNTGDVRIMPALDRALAGSSMLVRVAATEALRLLPGTATDTRLLALLGDGNGFVRAAAVFATGERDLRAFVAAFDRALHTDRELEVRRTIVTLAGARIAELPALRALVEYAAAHEPDAELRATAKALAAQQS
jgi:HEAT repeat protein